MNTPNVLERVRGELINTGRDIRYRLGGYEFVLNGMEFYLTSIGEKRHVTGQELSRGLLLFAHKQFGPLALFILKYWGIYATEDIGNIVYNMIDIGIMSKQRDDSIEHFINVITLDAYFDEQDNFEINPDFIKREKGA